MSVKEKEIVAALKRQDINAVEELVSSFGDRLLRSAYFLCGNKTDAEDLVQDTFIQAVKSVGRFKRKSALYTWLYGILLNLTRHYFRKRKKEVSFFKKTQKQINKQLIPASLNPDLQKDRENASSVFLDCMQTLSLRHREILLLRYFNEMKIKEISSLLGVSKGTVKSRLFYATKHLRKLLPADLNLFTTKKD